MSKNQPMSVKPFVPEDGSLKELAQAAQSCRGFELYLHATQAVFGAGPRKARIVLVGEQPGDREDLAGRDMRTAQDRGKWIDTVWAERLMVTIHPSALLRLPDRGLYAEEFARFLQDLRLVRD